MLIRRQQLYVRETNESFGYNEKTQTPHSVWGVAKKILGDEIEIQENLYAFYYDCGMKLIGFAHISKGDISSTIIAKRVIFKYAIDLLASSIIIVHNHPTGTLKASIEDTIVMNELREGAKILDIRLLDSLIISKNGFYSMTSEEVEVVNV